MDRVVVFAVAKVRVAHHAFFDEPGLGVDVDAFGVIGEDAKLDAVEVEFFEPVLHHQARGFDAVSMPAILLAAGATSPAEARQSLETNNHRLRDALAALGTNQKN